MVSPPAADDAFQETPSRVRLTGEKGGVLVPPRSSRLNLFFTLVLIVLNALVLAVLVPPPPQAAAQAPPKPFESTLEDPIVQIPAGAQGIDELAVRIKGTEAAPDVKPIDSAGPLSVTLTFMPPERHQHEDATLWYIPVTVASSQGANPLPANLLLRRRLSISGKEHTYWVTNLSPKDLSLTIIPSAESWLIDQEPGKEQQWCTPIHVYSGDIPAAGIGLLKSTLVEGSSKRRLGLDHLRLCWETGCNGPIHLPPRRYTPLRICLKDTFEGHGEFSGKLSLGTQQKPDLQTIDLNIYKTSRGVRWLGIGLIAAGVALGWLLRVLSRSRLDRLQALIPAAFLRGKVAALKTRIKELFPSPQSQPALDLPSVRTKVEEMELLSLGQDAGRQELHSAEVALPGRLPYD